MSESSIRNGVKNFIQERFMIGISTNSLRDSDSLLEKGIIDSTGVLELVGHLEENYNFSVEDDELTPENLGTVDSIVAYIQRKIPVSI